MIIIGGHLICAREEEINARQALSNAPEFNVHTCLRFYFKKTAGRCDALDDRRPLVHQPAISLMTQSVGANVDVTSIFSPAGIKRPDEDNNADGDGVKTPGL